MRAPANGRCGLDDANSSVVVFGEVDRALCDVGPNARPLAFPRLALGARRRGHLDLELLPELAEHGLVGLGRAADVHGTRIPVKR